MSRPQGNWDRIAESLTGRTAAKYGKSGLFPGHYLSYAVTGCCRLAFGSFDAIVTALDRELPARTFTRSLDQDGDCHGAGRFPDVVLGAGMKALKLMAVANKAKLFHYLTALWLLMKDSRTPLAAKLVAGVVVAYALSPIDLIPDFIPVLGLLDDVILVPLGVALAVKLVPPPLWAEMRQRADGFQGRLPKMMWGLLIVVAIWLMLLAAFIYWLVHSVLNA